MKNNTTNKIRLGIFIFIGIAILIAGIYFIGEGQQLFRNTFYISGVFRDVAGLQAGNNVRLSGVNVGTVKDVSIISDTSVRVEIIVDEAMRQFIKKDAVAIIGSEGLMGNKVLIINPGTGQKKKIENDDVIQTIQPISIDDIMLSLHSTIDNTSSITGDLSKITNKIQSGQGTIGRLIMDKSWGQNFDSTFVNLKEGSAAFKILMDKSGEVDEILLAIKTTIDNTSSITSDLSNITSRIESGEGTIGKLLTDKAFGQNIDSTLVNLKKVQPSLNCF